MLLGSVRLNSTIWKQTVASQDFDLEAISFEGKSLLAIQYAYVVSNSSFVRQISHLMQMLITV